jgi:hypothetical protein
MKRFKLGFGNRSVLEQIAICQRVADCIARLPAKHRQAMAGYPVAASVAETVEAVAEVEALKIALRTALLKRRIESGVHPIAMGRLAGVFCRI